MTAPGLDQDTLEVLVGPAAWAYHAALAGAEQVDTERAYLVHRDVRLVAASVLLAACTAARRAGAAASAGRLRRFKVEGEYEEEYFAPSAASTGDADAWCALAADLRAEVASERRAARRRGSTSVGVEVTF